MANNIKRFLTALLCMAMLMSLVPQFAFAATTELTEEQIASLTTPLLNSTVQVPDSGSGMEKVEKMLTGTGFTVQSATPDDCKFKAASGDTKEYILLRSVNAADGDGYFILSNTVDMNNENASKIAPFYSDTTNYKYDPDDTNSIASKLNDSNYISTHFPVMSAYIQEHTWYTESIKSNAVKVYSVNAKISLPSLTEYRANADRIGINVNGRNWMTRTPNDSKNLWAFSSTGIFGSALNSASSWLQIRTCFYVSEDFFKNVKLDTSYLTVDSEVSKLIVKLDSEGKLAENLYTEEELTTMGKSSGTSIEGMTVSGTGNLGDTVTAEYTVTGTAPASCKFKWKKADGTVLAETDEPTFKIPYSALGSSISCTVEAYNSDSTLIATAAASNSITTEAKPELKKASNGALTGFAATTPDSYKFTVGGSDFVLLKSVNADEKDGYFVVKDKQVLFSDSNRHYFYDDGDTTVGNAEFKFDSADEKSIANYINSSEYMDIAESYKASKTKAIPTDIRSYIKEHEWWVDGTSTRDPYKINAKITIMSYTEYMENIDRIGIDNEHNRYWYLRSPVKDTKVSVVNGNPTSPNYGKTAEENVDSYYPSHRPCFYIDSSFFKQNKLTFTAANTELIKVLRKELTYEEAVNLGYSGTELKLMGYDIDDLYFTNLEASQGDDGKYTISFGVENTTSDSLSFSIIAALYDGSYLTSTSILTEVTLEAGASDNTLTAVVDAKGISAESLKLKIFAWNNITECTPICATPIDNYLSSICAGDKKKITASDTALTYYGRWQTVGDEKHANWNWPYVKFDFTGTSLKAKFTGNVKATVVIDGSVKNYSDVSGITALAAGLDNTKHTAKITIKNADGKTGISAIYTDTDATVSKNTSSAKNIQFIGDSITTDTRSYSYTIPETYGYDYSIISIGGIALQDKSGWYGNNWEPELTLAERVGMESAYFCEKAPDKAYSKSSDGDWIYSNTLRDISKDETPDVIVIGLGTNDNYYINNSYAGLSQQDFEETYVDFVSEVANTYPDAAIYILRPFNNNTDSRIADFTKLRTAVKNAADRLANNNLRVYYIDTADWNVEFNPDADITHPTSAGYAALRDLVYNAIKGSLE